MEKKFFNPGYQVVLEGSFHDLMKEVRGNKFVYVCPWKLICEGLKIQVRITQMHIWITTLMMMSPIIP